MNSRRMLYALCAALLCLSACTVKPEATLDEIPKDTLQAESEPEPNPITSEAQDTDTRRYDVYEQGATYDHVDDFSMAMHENPIDRKLYDECLTGEATTGLEMRQMFIGYLDEWRAELDFSLANLKVYLSDDEAALLEQAQNNWETSLLSNNRFDHVLIGNHNIKLGTQYNISVEIYLISQYRERVFHIKYMTFLLEERTMGEKTPETDQTWNLFHIK